MNEALNDIVYEISRNQELCLVLGGDHSIASGSLHGQLMNHGDDLKVVWINAHTDLNNFENSPSGNYHGMSAGHILGTIPTGQVHGFDWLIKNVKSSNIVYVGLREMDPFEKEYIKDKNIMHFTPFDIDNMGGIGFVMRQIHTHFGIDTNKNPVFVSFDIDGMCSSVIEGTGTRVRYGLNSREAIFILQFLRYRF